MRRSAADRLIKYFRQVGCQADLLATPPRDFLHFSDFRFHCRAILPKGCLYFAAEIALRLCFLHCAAPVISFASFDWLT